MLALGIVRREGLHQKEEKEREEEEEEEEEERMGKLFGALL